MIARLGCRTDLHMYSLDAYANLNPILRFHVKADVLLTLSVLVVPLPAHLRGPTLQI